MIRLLLNKWRFPLFLLGFYILLNFLIWRQLAQQINSDRRETIDAAVAQNSNLAITLEQYTLKTLKDAEDALQLIKYLYGRNGQSLDFEELVDKKVLDLHSFSGAAILDNNGNIRKIYPSNLPGNINLADREFFTFQKNSSSDSFYLSEPIQSKTIDRTVLIVSRKINDSKGKFLGAIAIQIEPSAFMAFYNKANTRRYDIMSLISPNGITYSRRTGNIQSDGENISRSPLFDHLKRSAIGNYYAKDAIRGINTFFSYRKLQHYPIIATVGRTESDILSDFYKREKKTYFFGAVISLLILLFLLFIYIADLEKKKIAKNMTKEIIQAQERERETIGHELHDNVNQILSASKLYIELAAKDNTPTKDEKLHTAIVYIREGIAEIRKLSHELSSPTLGQKNLIDSIGSLIEPYAMATNIEIDFYFSDYHTNVDKDQALALYRIVQEALNNIIKHSEATKAEIILSQTDKETILLIRDNGKGFDLGAKRNGIGLNNIYSRTRVFNGKMLLTTTPGNGCLVEILFPLSKNTESPD